MSSPRLFLASASPRRRELMGFLGVPFEIRLPAVDESLIPGEPPEEAPLRISRLKAEAVARELDCGFLVAADTMVVHRGDILGKPHDAAEARAMLRRLRGERHRVLSGLTVMDAGTGRQIARLCESQVWLRPMGDEEIEAYVESGDPLDKAAAYAIQHAGFVPVARVVGCPANVMGLPMCRVVHSLRSLGLELPVSPATRCLDGQRCALADYVLPESLRGLRG